MPLYSYVCEECSNRFDTFAPINEAGNYRDCPACGKNLSSRRAYTTTPSVIFRPEGYNLSPDDPAYSHFEREPREHTEWQS